MKLDCPKPKTGCCYVRVSVDDGTVEHGSPEQQVHMGREWAKRLTERHKVEHHVKYVLREDGGISGGTTNRPQYQKMLDLIRSRRIDFIIAKEVTRLSRSTADFCQLVSLCKANNVAVHILDLDIDLNEPMGEMIFKVLATFGEMERQMTRKRISDSARSAAINNGKINGGPVILGFNSHPQKKGFWVPNEDELKHVRFLMETLVQTGSIKAALDEASRAGIQNKVGGKFRSDSLKRLLVNPKFIGKMYIQTKNGNEKREVDLPHGTVVPVELFHQVQGVFQKLSESKKNQNRRGTRIYTLTGLLQTVEGHFFCGQSGTGRNGERWFYYWDGKSKLRLAAEEAEDAVLLALRNAFQNDKEVASHLQQLEVSRVSKLQVVEGQRAKVLVDLQKLEKEEQATLAQLPSLANTAEVAAWLEKQVRRLEATKKDLREQLDALEREKALLEASDVDAKAYKGVLGGVFHYLKEADPIRQRHFYRQIFEKIIVYPDNRMELVWSISNVENEKAANLLSDGRKQTCGHVVNGSGGGI